MTAAQALSFRFESLHIRTLLINDQPWFCASDVCAVLGYKDEQQSLKDICRTEGVSLRDPIVSGTRQVLTFLNEGNLYRLILATADDTAKRFGAWVSDEVLPALLAPASRQEVKIKSGTVRRYLLSFTCDGEPQISEVPSEACVMSHREMIGRMTSSKELMVSTEEMFDFAMAALTYLKSRSRYQSSRLH